MSLDLTRERRALDRLIIPHLVIWVTKTLTGTDCCYGLTLAHSVRKLGGYF